MTDVPRALLTGLRGLVLTGTGPRSPFSAVLLWALLMVWCGVPGMLRDAPTTLPTDAHATLSMDLAFNANACGTFARLSSISGPTRVVASDPRLIDTPLPQLIGAEHGSVGVYCDSLTVPYLHNENSLMWLLRGTIWLRPDASMHLLGRAMSFVHRSILAVSAFVALWAGASLLSVAALMFTGETVLRLIDMPLSLYPFLVVMPMAGAALYGALLLMWPDGPGSGSALVAGTLAGVMTAAGANMRSSHLPILAMCFVAWVLVIALARRSRGVPLRAVLLGAGLLVGSGAAGYEIFQHVFIRPLRPSPAEGVGNYTHHSVAHPLVLGLAAPPSPFSDRLGIQWNDSTGLDLAREIDPETDYLGPRYENALFRYYVSLWKRFPRDMAQLYFLKVGATGHGMFEAIERLYLPFWPGPRGIRWLSGTVNGWVLFGLAATLASVASWRLPGSGVSLRFMMAVTSIAALLVLTESAIIMPPFIGMYHGYLLFFFAFLPVVAAQALADIGVSGMMRTRT